MHNEERCERLGACECIACGIVFEGVIITTHDDEYFEPICPTCVLYYTEK